MQKISKSYKMIIISTFVTISIILAFKIVGDIKLLDETSYDISENVFWYSLYIYTVMGFYTKQIYDNLHEVKFLNSLVIPHMVINLYFGFGACIVIRGGVMLWLLAVNMWFLIVLVVGGIIYGAYSDINYIKKRRRR